MTPRFVIEPARLAGPPLLRCQTDARLVDLVRAGNDRAFEIVVERYGRALLRYCGRLLPLTRAEDAVQQTFLNAYNAMKGGDADLELRPWLYRIARNVCLNALREGSWGDEAIELADGRVESAHETVERRQRLRAVVTAVGELPDRQREAVVLRELEGRTYGQIAELLDSSDGAVRQLLNRARNTLRAGATALTPVGLLSRMPGGQPAVAQVAEVAVHDSVRVGSARVAGALVTLIALVAGLSDTPRGAWDSHADLRAALADRDSVPRLAATAPQPASSRVETRQRRAPGGVAVLTMADSTGAGVPGGGSPRGAIGHVDLPSPAGPRAPLEPPPLTPVAPDPAQDEPGVAQVHGHQGGGADDSDRDRDRGREGHDRDQGAKAKPEDRDGDPEPSEGQPADDAGGGDDDPGTGHASLPEPPRLTPRASRPSSAPRPGPPPAPEPNPEATAPKPEAPAVEESDRDEPDPEGPDPDEPEADEDGVDEHGGSTTREPRERAARGDEAEPSGERD